MKRIITLAILLPFLTNAATYFIDYTGGNDASAGTSTGTAWKRHPYMQGWSGSYAHSAGDRFIFKGGVTWPSNCWLMVIAAGGSSTNNVDYYGVTNTWYSGGSWSRPIFDAESVMTGHVVLTNDAHYVTIDGIDFRGIRAQSNFGDVAVALRGNQYFTLTNCWLHAWTRAPSLTVDGQIGGFFNAAELTGSGITNVLVTHCTIGNADGDGNSGTAFYYGGELAYSVIHDVPEGVLHGGYSVHDNVFYNIVPSFDAAQHPNVAYIHDWNGAFPNTNRPALFYNNYIYGNVGSAEPIYPVGGGTFYIYNNVFIAENLKTVDIDPFAAGPSHPMTLYIFNNTFANASGTHIRVTDRNNSQPVLLSVINNHLIAGSAYTLAETQTFIYTNNLVQASYAAANADGYFSASFYQPTTATGDTISGGTNLTALAITALDYTTSRGNNTTPIARRSLPSAWDIGAYQWADEPPPVLRRPRLLRPR